MFVSILLVRGVLAELQSRGIQGNDWLADFGIDGMTVADTRAVVSMDRWERFLERAMRVLGDPGLGMTVGLRQSDTVLQLFGYMMLSSCTLQHAFELCERYSRLLVDGLRVELEQAHERVHFRFGFAWPASENVIRFGEDLTAVMALKIARHHAPSGLAPELFLRQPCPIYRRQFDAHLGCPIRFGQIRNELVFNREALTKAQAHGDSRVTECLSLAADRLLLDMPAQPTLADRVRLALSYETELHLIDIRAVARRLGMNPRLLQRRLHEEGLLLRTLVDERRMQVARASLATPNTSVKDTCERLGFSEVSAFHRAFKRWTGISPASYQRELRDAHHTVQR